MTAAGASASAALIRSNLRAIRERIERAALRAGRDPAGITLVGASKTVPPEAVADAVEAGLTHLGENRVQEARDKIPRVRELLASRGVDPPPWYMIGHLQSNKAAAAMKLFAGCHSVDSLHLAQLLSRHAAAGQTYSILLEVYVGDDPGRPGVRPADLAGAVAAVSGLPGVRLDGLMTVAPLGADPAETRAAFRQVRELSDALADRFGPSSFRHLSMGMTDDFEVAIEEGSTMVRIGRALFGARA